MHFNIDYEKQFIDLLGYTVLEKDNSNRWVITDENNIPVGFIQYKKLKSKDMKRNIPAQFGYHTEIRNDNLQFIRNRNENNLGSNRYEFDFNDMHVEMLLENIASLIISSQEYGFISFVLDKHSLNFNYKRQTDNFNIEEFVQVNSLPNQESFTYSLSFTDKNNDPQFGNDNITTFSIAVNKDANMIEDQILITLTTFRNNVLKSKEDYLVEGSIKEVIEGLELATLSLDYLRSFLEEILPIKEDIISFMFNYLNIKQENLLLLCSENLEGKARKLDFN